jgi:hypothetical protein
MAGTAPLARRISGAAFAGVMLVAAGLVFYLEWLLGSPTSAFTALLGIGVLALVFALVAYVLQAMVQQPILARATSWGFLAMGFTVLFVTVGLYPDEAYSSTARLEYALLFLALLAISLLGIYWRSGALAQEAQRGEARARWQAQPPTSAFDYAAARPANVPPPNVADAPGAPPGPR